MLLDAGARFRLSELTISEWAEANMKVTSGKYQGNLSYHLTPYFRELVERAGPYSGFTEMVLMGAAQMGKTRAFIESVINYYISQFPRNIGYYTGDADLSEDSMKSLDNSLQGCGNDLLIKSQVIKPRNNSTGNTVKWKEYPGGKLHAQSATQANKIRQRDEQLIFADDIEASKSNSRNDGSTVSLIRKRANSYGDDKLIIWSSTPKSFINLSLIHI